MPQYCVAKSLPSGVGSENAISSLLKYEPYMKLLLRHSIIREAIFFRRIMLNTHIRLIPQMAGSGEVEQHHAFCLSNMTISFSELISGTFSSITL